MRTPDGQGGSRQAPASRGGRQNGGRRGGRTSARQPQSRGPNQVRVEEGLVVNQVPRGAGAYPQELEPAVLAGDVVELVGMGKFRVVEQVFPQPSILAFDSRNNNGISVGANTSDEDNEATNLGQETSRLAQLRWFNPAGALGDSVIARVDQGGANTPLHKTKNYIGQIDKEAAAVLASAVTEFYVFENDNNPFFTFINSAGSSRTINDVRFAGFQYVVNDEDITKPPDVRSVPLPVARGPT